MREASQDNRGAATFQTIEARARPSNTGKGLSMAADILLKVVANALRQINVYNRVIEALLVPSQSACVYELVPWCVIPSADVIYPTEVGYLERGILGEQLNANIQYWDLDYGA